MNDKTWPLHKLVDHRGPMAFIDELVSARGDTGHCRAVIRADNPFLLGNRLPAWVLVEYMAQSVAVFAGYIRASGGMVHRHGLLLGCRNLRMADVALEVGTRLEIDVVETARFENLGNFSSKVICNASVAARGTLSVYEAAEWPTPITGLSPDEEPQNMNHKGT